MLSKVLYLMGVRGAGGFLAWLVYGAVHFGRYSPLGGLDGAESVWRGVGRADWWDDWLRDGAGVGHADAHMLRGALLGAAVGLLGGTIGVVIGQILVCRACGEPACGGADCGAHLGWSAFGALVGLAEGWWPPAAADVSGTVGRCDWGGAGRRAV